MGGQVQAGARSPHARLINPAGNFNLLRKKSKRNPGLPCLLPYMNGFYMYRYRSQISSTIDVNMEITELLGTNVKTFTKEQWFMKYPKPTATAEGRARHVRYWTEMEAKQTPSLSAFICHFELKVVFTFSNLF